ncbi:MAG: hypothetical protein J5626_11290 [Lachnospiraceae bacterium]|nr:hypothetical protein [Lachnospiraceae bacterium]
MKLVRSVAYAVIVICALLCIVIAIYASKKSSGDEEGEETVSFVTVTSPVSDSSEVSVTVPNIADLILDRPQSGSASSSKTSISGNNTGEISYDEIVKRQNEDLDREFRNVISDYNKKYGIEVKKPTSTTTTVSKDYKYFVNKNTKLIHRIDCLLKPVNSSDMLYYETIKAAEKAGYKERCPVCSP